MLELPSSLAHLDLVAEIQMPDAHHFCGVFVVFKDVASFCFKRLPAADGKP